MFKKPEEPKQERNPDYGLERFFERHARQVKVSVLMPLTPSEMCLRLTYSVPLRATKRIQNAQDPHTCRDNRLPTKQPTHPSAAWI